MSAWEAAAKERIRQRLSKLREKLEDQEKRVEISTGGSPSHSFHNGKCEEIRDQIDFLEQVLSLTKSPSEEMDMSSLKMEEDGRWY